MGRNRVIFYALKEIKAGQLLYINYNGGISNDYPTEDFQWMIFIAWILLLYRFHLLYYKYIHILYHFSIHETIFWKSESVNAKDKFFANCSNRDYDNEKCEQPDSINKQHPQWLQIHNKRHPTNNLTYILKQTNTNKHSNSLLILHRTS